MSGTRRTRIRVHSVKSIGQSGDALLYGLEISMTLEDAKRSGFDPRDLISSEIVLEAVKPPMLGGPADKKYFMDEFVKSVRDAAGPISKEHRAQKYDAETADVVNRVNVTLGGGSTVKPDHPAALCSACHKVWLHRGETSCWKCGWKRG